MSRRKNSWADHLILAPWWVSAALALLAYVLLPSVLPKAVVNGGLVGLITLVLLAISAISALRSLRTKSLLGAQTGLDSLRDLPSKRFEDVIAEAYRRQGYHVKEMLGSGADGGIDLLLRKNGNVVVVQCKRWRGKPVPVEIVRELYGVMIHEQASSWQRRALLPTQLRSRQVSPSNSWTRKPCYGSSVMFRHRVALR
jgi:restriction system protein